MAKKIMRPDYLYKVVSIAVAVILWFFVAYAENPETELWFKDIPVSYVNEGTLSEKELIRIKGEEETVSVKVKADRKAIMSLSSSNIIATVDLSLVKSAKTTSLPINIKFPVDGITVADKKPFNVNVVTEKRLSKELPVEVLFEGKETSGVKIKEYESSLESVTVTGGETVIGAAEGCVAKLNISEISTNKMIPVLISLKMTDGTVYEGDGVTFSNTHTNVKVKVDITREIPVSAVYGEGLSEIITGTKIVPSTIKISGGYEEVSTISKIETLPISVSRKSETEKVTAKIKIPEGLENVDKIEEVEVSTTIAKDSVRR